MTAIVSRLKTHFANWRGWELNPIVVKELRQSVRSWTVIGMLLLFLTVMFFTALSFLVSQSFQVNEEAELGSRVFSAFLVILTIASLLFIPLYVGVRLASERQESNLDLLYVTTLTPARIIRGKFLCGAYMAVLFFSACLPFMVFTNLLRGVDLPTVFFIMFCLFLTICAAIHAAIFLACLPISKLFKILMALISVIIGLRLIFSLSMVFFELMFSGIGSALGGGDFWAHFLSNVGVLAAVVVLLHFLSIALISPPSANRALPLRGYYTVLWAFGAGLAFYWTIKDGDTEPLLAWAWTSFVLLIGALLVVISNNDLLSLRVRRAIPKRKAWRDLAFLFYNGAAGGMIWVAALLGTTLAVVSASMRLLQFSSRDADEMRNFELTYGALLAYVFAYALTALFLHRRFLPKRPAKLAGILAILLPSAWALVPYIASFFLNRLSWRELERGLLGNVFNIFVVRDPSQKQAHLIFALVWLLLMLVLNAKWFRDQVRHFKPLDREAQPPVIAPVSAPGSTAGN